MRRNFCSACNALANGVKSRIALEHTCGLEQGVMPASLRNDIIEEKSFRHKWKQVEISENEKYAKLSNEKKYECELCGCIKFTSTSFFNGRPMHHVQYERSKIITSDTAPECWGAKNPQ